MHAIAGATGIKIGPTASAPTANPTKGIQTRKTATAMNGVTGPLSPLRTRRCGSAATSTTVLWVRSPAGIVARSMVVPATRRPGTRPIAEPRGPHRCCGHFGHREGERFRWPPPRNRRDGRGPGYAKIRGNAATVGPHHAARRHTRAILPGGGGRSRNTGREYAGGEQAGKERQGTSSGWPNAEYGDGPFLVGRSSQWSAKSEPAGEQDRPMA
jgi:hypothetical protein